MSFWDTVIDVGADLVGDIFTDNDGNIDIGQILDLIGGGAEAYGDYKNILSLDDLKDLWMFQNPNVSTPFGAVNIRRDGNGGTVSETVLSDGMQQFFDGFISDVNDPNRSGYDPGYGLLGPNSLNRALINDQRNRMGLRPVGESPNWGRDITPAMPGTGDNDRPGYEQDPVNSGPGGDPGTPQPGNPAGDVGVIGDGNGGYNGANPDPTNGYRNPNFNRAPAMDLGLSGQFDTFQDFANFAADNPWLFTALGAAGVTGAGLVDNLAEMWIQGNPDRRQSIMFPDGGGYTNFLGEYGNEATRGATEDFLAQYGNEAERDRIAQQQQAEQDWLNSIAAQNQSTPSYLDRRQEGSGRGFGWNTVFQYNPNGGSFQGSMLPADLDRGDRYQYGPQNPYTRTR